MNTNEKGFSLIELLLVVVILGIITAIAVPNLQKVTSLARNAGAYSLVRNMSTIQLNYFSVKGRYARLDELNAFQGSALGEMNGTNLLRGRFSYELSPPNPTDEQLKEGYSIIGTKLTGPGETPYVLIVDQTGVILENPFDANP